MDDISKAFKKKRTMTDIENDIRNSPDVTPEDTPEAHWERFKTATRILATTPKPAKISSCLTIAEIEELRL